MKAPTPLTLSLSLFLLLIAAACSKPPAAPSAGQATTGTVQHVVVCWLKQPGDPTARAQLIGTSLGFKDLPGVVDVQAGTPLPSDRPVVDDSFDVALTMTFRDEAALRAYENHPAHKKAVEDVLKPLVARFVVYDFVSP
ncbi:MAG: Dabb family protein [Candidatus Methylacidiphilales bacterium]|nr:Dabb family protein [Candidatus Methylacidiphilales bacterium]